MTPVDVVEPLGDFVATPQVQAAVVAAVVALAVGWINNKNATMAREQADRQREADLLRAQLNGLYGPVFMRRRAS